MKKFTIAMFAFMLISLTLMTSCQGEVIEKTTFENTTYSEIPLNFELDELQSETCCYVDEQIMLFTVGTRNGKPEGPLVSTDYMMTYDYKEGQIRAKYEVETEGYIFSAVPYEDGIIYVDYDGNLAETKWQVRFISETENLILDEGESDSYAHTPRVTLIDGVPVYVWQNTPGEENVYGINKVVDMESLNIFKDEENTLSYVYFKDNSKEYCFLISKPDYTYGTIVVGDMNGIRYTYDLEEKLNSFGMTEDYVVCSTAESEEQKHLIKLKIDSGKAEEAAMSKHLYKLTGLEDNTCLLVDYDFNMFQLDVDSEELIGLPLPEEFLGQTHSTAYYPINRDKCIVEFGLEDSDVYYMMEKS